MEARKLRILFVDDEPHILSGLKRLLWSLKGEWECYFAGSGPEALQLLERQEVEVVVSDMRMPGMDGAQLLKAIKDRHPHILRLILSGQSERQKVCETVRVAHQYLTKPCDLETLKNTLQRARLLCQLLADRALREVVSRIETLPSLPALYQEILQELESEYCSVQRVGEIISQDIGMCAKVLQLVNSAFFGFYHHVTNPIQAVELLGTETIKVLVLSEKIFSVLEARTLAELHFDTLWEHSLITGMMAKGIAKQERLPQSQAEMAFMAGVLHDSGKLILASNFPDAYKDTVRTAEKAGLPLHVAEIQSFGVSHGEIGAYLLALWGLPDILVEAIACHHKPPESREVSLPAILYLSNLLYHAKKGDEACLGGPGLETGFWGDNLKRWEGVWEKYLSAGEAYGTENPLCGR